MVHFHTIMLTSQAASSFGGWGGEGLNSEHHWSFERQKQFLGLELY